ADADELKGDHAPHFAHCHSAQAFYCLDYSKHLRTLAECMRMDVLDRENGDAERVSFQVETKPQSGRPRGGKQLKQMEETSKDIVTHLREKAFYWRQEAERFAGRPEELICLEHARHAETLAELERLKRLRPGGRFYDQIFARSQSTGKPADVILTIDD